LGPRLAEADARRAIELAPDLAEGHLALGYHFRSLLDFQQAPHKGTVVRLFYFSRLISFTNL
jgi:hypothetical protein